eukprot:3459335-Pyramimonas_sp.AAC.1
MASLRILVRALGVMEKLAGLKIKISKCTRVVANMTKALRTMTKAQLASIAGAWADFAIDGWLLYLGMILGPDATVERNWEGPLQKA